MRRLLLFQWNPDGLLATGHARRHSSVRTFTVDIRNSIRLMSDRWLNTTALSSGGYSSTYPGDQSPISLEIVISLHEYFMLINIVYSLFWRHRQMILLSKIVAHIRNLAVSGSVIENAIPFGSAKECLVNRASSSATQIPRDAIIPTSCDDYRQIR